MADAAGGVLGQLIELTTHYPDNPTFRTSFQATQMKAVSVPGIVTTIVPVDVEVRVSVLGRWRFDSSSR